MNGNHMKPLLLSAATGIFLAVATGIFLVIMALVGWIGENLTSDIAEIRAATVKIQAEYSKISSMEQRLSRLEEKIDTLLARK